MKKKKVITVVLTIVGILVAMYTLFPFYLVVMNAFKNANGIVANPVAFEGMSFSQLLGNLSNALSFHYFQFLSQMLLIIQILTIGMLLVHL